MTKQDPVEGRQRETKVEIMTKQDPVEGRQRETNGDRPGIMLEQDPVEGRQRETNGDKWRQTWKSCWNKVCFFARIENPIS